MKGQTGNRFVVEIAATRDPEGRFPLPRLVGPFPSRTRAVAWAEGQKMFGEWAVVKLAAPRVRSRPAGEGI